MKTFAQRWISSCLARPKTVFLTTLFLTIFSVSYASKLEIRSNLKELLPQEAQSVKALDRVIENVGGVGTLIVGVESESFDANRRFVEDLVLKLQTIPKEYFRNITYRADEAEAFFDKHALLYLSENELDEIHEEIKRRLELEKLKANPFYIDLNESNETSDTFSFEKIESEIQSKTPDLGISRYNSYFGTDDGKFLIVTLRSQGSNMSLEFAKDLIARVQTRVQELSPSTYHPTLRVGLSGTFPSSVEETDAIRNDIASTALLCIAMVVVILFSFLRQVKPIILLSATLLIAISWTFALTKFFIGFLNAQTAFLGSLILGTGINYGIILWCRYVEERSIGRDLRDALFRASSHTFVPTFLAAATSATAFTVLSVSGVRSLAQFGLIGSTGVLLAWLATFTFFPVLILWLDQKTNYEGERFFSRPAVWTHKLSSLIEQNPKFIISSFVVSMIVMGSIAWRYIPSSMEYNFDNLRNRSSRSSGSDYWDRKVGKVLTKSTVPTVAHLSNASDAKEYCETLLNKVRSLPPERQFVGNCTTVWDLIPEKQTEKMAKIQKIRLLLDDPWISSAKESFRKELKEAERYLHPTIITASSLPLMLTNNFEDAEGDIHRVAFISPLPGKHLSNGHNLLGYADNLRDTKLTSGAMIFPAADALIFSDIIRIIEEEGVYLSAYAFLSVLVLFILLSRSPRVILAFSSSLLLGIGFMLGLFSLFSMKINFFNFIAVPLTVGIAADYGANIALRLYGRENESLHSILHFTGRSVVLCSSTTLVSYFVLTQAQNQALGSFGKIAILGEISCLIAALVFLPALYAGFQKKRAYSKDLSETKKKIAR